MTTPPPLQPSRTSTFKADVERCRRRRYDMDLLRVTMGRLIHRTPLLPPHKEHPLSGAWAGHRECHVQPDWLLIYRVSGDEIVFERTRTHSDLFEE